MKIQMHRFLSSNRHAKHIQHYVINCSIGDWFVLYQVRFIFIIVIVSNNFFVDEQTDEQEILLRVSSPSINKSENLIEIIAIELHIKSQVNPDPYLRADPEIDIMKEEDDDIANGSAFYDEEALGESLNDWMKYWHLCISNL